MRRVGVRVLMFLVGFSLLTFYLLAAIVGYRVVLVLWAERPDPVTAVVMIVTMAVLFGYLSYRYGTARLLAGLDAHELPREYAPDLHRRLDRVAGRMDVERPRLVVAQMAAPNALALGGRGSGVVVVDRSLFRILDAPAFEAILAHELAHLESNDGLVQTVAYSTLRTVVGLVVLPLVPLVVLVTGLARAVAWMSGRPLEWDRTPLGRVRYRVGQAIALLFLLLTAVVRAHSRRREYAADDRAIEITGDPLALARALRHIDRASQPGWGLLSPLYIDGDEEGTLTRLLSTHPPMDERIERIIERVERDRPQARRISIE